LIELHGGVQPVVYGEDKETGEIVSIVMPLKD
jgi:hypothetical protein